MSILFPAKYSYVTAKRQMLSLKPELGIDRTQGSTADYAVIYQGSRFFAAGQNLIFLNLFLWGGYCCPMHCYLFRSIVLLRI